MDILLGFYISHRKHGKHGNLSWLLFLAESADSAEIIVDHGSLESSRMSDLLSHTKSKEIYRGCCFSQKARKAQKCGLLINCACVILSAVSVISA